MPQSQPGGESRLNSRSIRDHNLSLVLHELARTRGCSRSRLRETTGLTPGAVTLLVNELIDAGMIETSDTMRAEGGRRKKQLALAGDSYPVAVVELRRDGIAAALETFGGTRLMDVHAPKTFYGKSVEEFADAAAEQIVALDQCATESVERPLVAVGVVMPIGVLVDNSTILPIGAFGWDMVDLGSLIATRLREQGLTLPVVVLSAPACAGWAEYRALYDDESIETPQGVLYVAPDVTDGGSLIIRGRLYRGVLGTAVEIGHTQVEAEGELCTCGKRGCLAAYAGTDAIIRACGLEEYRAEHGTDEALREARSRRAAGDPAVCAVIDRAVRCTRVAIENALTLLNADCVVLGGRLKRYRDEIQAVDNGFTSLGVPGVTSFVAGRLDDEAALLGGLMRMRRALIDHVGDLMRGTPLTAETFLQDMV